MQFVLFSGRRGRRARRANWANQGRGKHAKFNILHFGAQLSCPKVEQIKVIFGKPM